MRKINIGKKVRDFRQALPWNRFKALSAHLDTVTTLLNEQVQRSDRLERLLKETADEVENEIGPALEELKEEVEAKPSEDDMSSAIESEVESAVEKEVEEAMDAADWSDVIRDKVHEALTEAEVTIQVTGGGRTVRSRRN